jgi:DivIVA domain-containing protein
MAWVFMVLAVALVLATALVLAGRLPVVPQPTRDRFQTALPPQPTASDVDVLRFPVAFRGYRMDDVDAALAVLRARIAQLEGDASYSDANAAMPPSPFAPTHERSDDD